LTRETSGSGSGSATTGFPCVAEERVAGREDCERDHYGLLQQGHQDHGHRHQVLPWQRQRRGGIFSSVAEPKFRLRNRKSCFSKVTKIMVTAIKFFLGSDNDEVGLHFYSFRMIGISVSDTHLAGSGSELFYFHFPVLNPSPIFLPEVKDPNQP
jgi:hypothetical protein